MICYCKNSTDVDVTTVLGETTTTRNVGQGHWVKMHAKRIGQEQLLWKVVFDCSYQCCKNKLNLT